MSTSSAVLPQLLAPINELAAPLIKAGFANPLLFTPGATVLEVRGRTSGQIRTVPLTCYLAGGVMIIGTVRPNSQWIKNLAAAEGAHVWLWGRRLRATKLWITEHVACLTFVNQQQSA